MSTSARASTADLLSQLIAISIPAVLGLYWVAYASAYKDFAIMLFRPTLVMAALALALLYWHRIRVTQVEQKLAGVLAILCSVLLASSLTATDPVRALQEWLKLVIICGFGLMLCRALRNPNTSKAFGISLIAASVLIAVLIVTTYLQHMGLVLPTYKTVREFKGLIVKSDVPLNTIPFACVFSYICGMCLLRGSKLLWSLGVVLLVVSSVLTGSRAPVASLFVGVLVLIVINAVRSRKLLVSVAGWILVSVFALGAATTTMMLDFKSMSAITEGRWDLWSVAIQKSMERPILGYGYVSWEDDLASRLPGAYDLTHGLEKQVMSGGYHNEYLTAFAEQGVFGFFAVVSLFYFLFRCSWNLAFRYPDTTQNGQWVLFGCLVLLVRAGVETPGLFGNAQEPADFLAYSFLAIVVSSISREEDLFARRAERNRQTFMPLTAREMIYR